MYLDAQTAIETLCQSRWQSAVVVFDRLASPPLKAPMDFENLALENADSFQIVLRPRIVFQGSDNNKAVDQRRHDIKGLIAGKNAVPRHVVIAHHIADGANGHIQGGSHNKQKTPDLDGRKVAGNDVYHIGFPECQHGGYAKKSQ